ncbi:hypothetical protein QYF61_026153 [Mycteria americana]|uniref:Uncharacterized protein n=1 Tax=Mycteria americana TaxID=33587 RepID=A0AAN7NQ27_MYCAM|nr:hypothetical protein QYF61_026153 [Mycteria americana]
MKGPEHLSDEERLRELGLFSLGKGRLQGTSSMWRVQRGRSQALSVVPSDRTRGDGHQLKHRRFPLNTRKHFVTVRVTKHWHRLPREVVESPSLEIRRNHLDTVLVNLLVEPACGLSLDSQQDVPGSHSIQGCFLASVSFYNLIHNFLTLLVSEPPREGTLLDLLFVNREGLVGDVTAGCWA